MPRFNVAALRARLPALAPLEKSALAILLSLLASGALLRAWENSGVSLGPVDDWAGLRTLVLQARPGGAGPWPCAAPAAFAPDRAGAKKAARKRGKAEGGDRKKAPAGLLDLNTASEKQLGTLPGVGPSTARAIAAWRAAHAGFSAPEELLEVKGIGPKKFEALRPFVQVRRPARAPEGAGNAALASPEPSREAADPVRNPLSDTIPRGLVPDDGSRPPVWRMGE